MSEQTGSSVIGSNGCGDPDAPIILFLPRRVPEFRGPSDGRLLPNGKACSSTGCVILFSRIATRGLPRQRPSVAAIVYLGPDFRGGFGSKQGVHPEAKKPGNLAVRTAVTLLLHDE